MVIGIYCGYGKPRNIKDFLQPFVDEMKKLLVNGVRIYENNHSEIKKTGKIDVKIKCFICDSPARAFVKGKLLNYEI